MKKIIIITATLLMTLSMSAQTSQDSSTLLGKDGGGLFIHPWAGKIQWRRKWQPTPVILPGELHGQRSLVGYRPWSHKESDMTE